VKNVILVSLLRFPNRDFHELSPLPRIENPFAPNTVQKPLPIKVHAYRDGVVEPKSTKEIAEHFDAYDKWTWPKI
jgi:hypothetical protein